MSVRVTILTARSLSVCREDVSMRRFVDYARLALGYSQALRETNQRVSSRNASIDSTSDRNDLRTHLKGPTSKLVSQDQDIDDEI